MALILTRRNHERVMIKVDCTPIWELIQGWDDATLALYPELTQLLDELKQGVIVSVGDHIPLRRDDGKFGGISNKEQETRLEKTRYRLFFEAPQAFTIIREELLARKNQKQIN